MEALDYSDSSKVSVHGQQLVNPKLIFTDPTPNRYSHIGGGLEIGPDNNLYLTV